MKNNLSTQTANILRPKILLILILIIIFTFGCFNKTESKSDTNLLNHLSSSTESFLFLRLSNPDIKNYLINEYNFNYSSNRINDVLANYSNQKIDIKSLIQKISQIIPSNQIIQLSNQALFAILKGNEVSNALNNPSEFMFAIQFNDESQINKISSTIASIAKEYNFEISTKIDSSTLIISSSKKAIDEFIANTNSTISSENASLLENTKVFSVANISLKSIQNFGHNLDSAVISTDQLTELPIESLRLSQEFGAVIKTDFNINLKPKNAEQEKLLKNLNFAKKDVGQILLPDTTILSASFSAPLLSTLIEGGLSDISREEKKDFQQLLSSITDINDLTIGVLKLSQDSLFPDIFIDIDSQKSDSLYNIIKDQLQGAISSQVPMSHWLEKEMRGVRYLYVQSPIGLGVYIANKSGRVVIASSESALLDAATVTSGKDLLTTLNAKGYLLNKQSGIFTSTINFSALASLIEAIQGSVSMFTGGSQTLDNESIVALKRVGNCTINIQVSDKTIQIQIEQPKIRS